MIRTVLSAGAKAPALLAIAIGVLWAAQKPSAQQAGRAAALDLVSTWTLASLEQGVGGGQPTRVANPRGLLIFDAAGHAYEFVTSLGNQRTTGGQTPVADAQSAFAGYGGFWGNYRVDAAQKKLTYKPEGAVSPQMMGGREFSRSFESAGDRLTLTSLDEPHAPGGTRWVWERAPTVDNLSPLYRRVVGFWQHVVEKRESDDGRGPLRIQARAERDRLHAVRFRRGALSAAQPEALRH